MLLPSTLLPILLPLLTHTHPLIPRSNNDQNNHPKDPLPPSPYIPAVAISTTATSSSVNPTSTSTSATIPNAAAGLNLPSDAEANIDPANPLNPDGQEVGSRIKSSNSTLPPSLQGVSYAKSKSDSPDSSGNDDFANLKKGGRKGKRDDSANEGGDAGQVVGSSIPYDGTDGDARNGVGAKALNDFNSGSSGRTQQSGVIERQLSSAMGDDVVVGESAIPGGSDGTQNVDTRAVERRYDLGDDFTVEQEATSDDSEGDQGLGKRAMERRDDTINDDGVETSVDLGDSVKYWNNGWGGEAPGGS